MFDVQAALTQRSTAAGSSPGSEIDAARRPGWPASLRRVLAEHGVIILAGLHSSSEDRFLACSCVVSARSTSTGCETPSLGIRS